MSWTANLYGHTEGEEQEAAAVEALREVVRAERARGNAAGGSFHGSFHNVTALGAEPDAPEAPAGG